MTEVGDHFAILPSAVRYYEIEQAAFLARFLPLEQPLGVPREFENLHALVHVRLVGGLVPFDFAQAAPLLLPPLVRHFFIEGRVDEAVELVDVHCVDTVLKPLVFGLQPPDRFAMLAQLVGVAGVQRVAHPFQHLVIELQPAEHLGESLFQHLLANIAAATGGRIALALIGIAGAMIIDVALLLDLTDDGAAALRAADQAGEGEIVLAALRLLGQTAVHHALNALPHLDRDQWLVLALDELAVPFELAGIEPVAQYSVHRAHRHLGAALAKDEASSLRLFRCFLQRDVADGVPFEQLGDDWRGLGVGGNDPLAVRAGNVAIAERRLGRPDACSAFSSMPLRASSDRLSI